MPRTKRRLTENSDAVFVGWQKMSSGEEFPLYNITSKHHPSKDSTVSNDTLRKLNLRVPTTPTPSSSLTPNQNPLVRLWRHLLFQSNKPSNKC
jgi:hypothetical protein